jgi:hypothetical protein
MTAETKESINRFLCEWIRNGYCHDPKHIVLHFGEQVCPECFRLCPGKEIDWPDYFTPEGFFQIWNKAKESKEWGIFLVLNGRHWKCSSGYDLIKINLVNPQVFIPEWARFLGWKEGECQI